MNQVGFQSAPDEFYHDYAIVNVAHSDRIIEGLRFVYVELPKFKPRSVMEKKMAVLWLRFLTEISEQTEEAPAELLANAETRKALSIVEKSAMSEGQLYAYEKFWSAVINEEALIEGGYKKGVERGFKQGVKQGIEQGIERGIERGIEQRNIDIARKMKEKGMSSALISEMTGLTAAQIDAL